MRFQTPLVPARLIRRYKRFLADIRLDDGTEVTAHCANPGSMMGLKDPGLRIWVEPNDDPKKKLKYGWRLVEHENGHFTGVDTSIPNRALRDALLAGKVEALAGYAEVLPEQKYAEKSRIGISHARPCPASSAGWKRAPVSKRHPTRSSPACVSRISRPCGRRRPADCRG